MRSFTLSRPSWSASSTARASPRSVVLVGVVAPRQVEHRVEPVADPRVLGVLLRPCARAGRAPCRSRRAPCRARSSSASLVRYSATTSSSPSPSSLRIASIWRRSNISRCCLSRSSLTSVRILSFSSRSASTSRAHAIASSRRASTSIVSSSSHALLHREVGRVRGRVGERAGLVDARRARRRCGARRGARGSSRRRRGTRCASSRTRGRRRARRAARPGRAARPRRPGTPLPMRARPMPRMTRAWVPLGSSPALSIWVIVPTVAKRPSIRGTRTSRPPAASAAARGPLGLVALERDRDHHLRAARRRCVSGRSGRSSVRVSDIVPVQPPASDSRFPRSGLLR